MAHLYLCHSLALIKFTSTDNNRSENIPSFTTLTDNKYAKKNSPVNSTRNLKKFQNQTKTLPDLKYNCTRIDINFYQNIRLH